MPDDRGRSDRHHAAERDELDVPDWVSQPRRRSEVRARRRSGRGRHRARPRHSADHRAARGGPARAPDPPATRADRRRSQAARARRARLARLRRTVTVGGLMVLAATLVAWVAVEDDPSSVAASLVAASSLPSSPVEAVGATAVFPGTTVADAALPAGPRPTVATGASASVGSTTPSPTATPTPTPSPVATGDGQMSWVGWGEVPEVRTSGGQPVRVALEIEGGLGLDEQETASTVASILVDPRGWQTERDVRFVFVTEAQAARGEFDTRIGIASKTTTMRLCGSVKTEGYTSCYYGRVVINLDRWMLGVESYDGHLDEYRTYVVNHEVGHSFGLGHDGCPGEGEPAPVMVPQTLHLWGCAPNPYPVLD